MRPSTFSWGMGLGFPHNAPLGKWPGCRATQPQKFWVCLRETQLLERITRVAHLEKKERGPPQKKDAQNRGSVVETRDKKAKGWGSNPGQTQPWPWPLIAFLTQLSVRICLMFLATNHKTNKNQSGALTANKMSIKSQRSSFSRSETVFVARFASHKG